MKATDNNLQVMINRVFERGTVIGHHKSGVISGIQTEAMSLRLGGAVVRRDMRWSKGHAFRSEVLLMINGLPVARWVAEPPASVGAIEGLYYAGVLVYGRRTL